MLIKPILAAVLLVVVASFAVPWTGRWWPDTRPSGNDTVVVDVMRKHLEAWGIGKEDMNPDIITRYFRFLSQAELRTPAEPGKTEQAANHPYARFVRRLPNTPAKPQGDRWSDNEVTKALIAILKKLDPSASETTGAVALERIAEELDYDRWRKTSINADPDQCFAHAPSDSVADYVERFRKGSSIRADIVDEMRECLIAWSVDERYRMEIEHARKVTVIRHFFKTLSRPADSLNGLIDDDKKHAYWIFLERLPADNCQAWTGDDIENIEKRIRAIAVRLTLQTNGQSDVNLIAQIRHEMDYDNWLNKQDKKDMKKDGEPSCERLKEIVSRFRAGKR